MPSLLMAVNMPTQRRSPESDRVPVNRRDGSVTRTARPLSGATLLTPAWRCAGEFIGSRRPGRRGESPVSRLRTRLVSVIFERVFFRSLLVAGKGLLRG
jgi:hypothetical protein